MLPPFSGVQIGRAPIHPIKELALVPQELALIRQELALVADYLARAGR